MIYSDNESEDMKEGGNLESCQSGSPERQNMENREGTTTTPQQKEDGNKLASTAGNIVITSNSIEPVKKQT